MAFSARTLENMHPKLRRTLGEFWKKVKKRLAENVEIYTQVMSIFFTPVGRADREILRTYIRGGRVTHPLYANLLVKVLEAYQEHLSELEEKFEKQLKEIKEMGEMEPEKRERIEKEWELLKKIDLKSLKEKIQNQEELNVEEQEFLLLLIEGTSKAEELEKL